ncbi:MAG TPA: molybdopterin-dependent oxidoreductase [Pseudonocardiaceae bacterium]|nr:molybdopterin-dependent oxidoreductase [Pseudonocardiaceae bacterium]
MNTEQVPIRTRIARLGIGGGLGIIAAGAALGVGELIAAFTGAATAPALAVGSAMVNLAPHAVKDFAVREFGTNDKLVLVSGVLAGLVALAAIAGILALRRLWLGVAIVVAFGVVGMLTAATGPATTAVSVLPSLGAAVTGAFALVLLVRIRRREPVSVAATGFSRRQLLIAGGSVALFAAATAVGGQYLQSALDSVTASRNRIRLPRPASPAPALPAGHQFQIDGLTPYFTPNNDFYRVDTALALPQVPAEQWSLTVHGMVRNPVRMSYQDILGMPLVERDITLSCVSNDVSGPYVSTARWLGVPLSTVLNKGGVRSGATQLLSTSTDGMTIGSPTEIVLDGRDALLAIAMNGEPLPIEHGFPARLLVPGLFGYASATKWVTDLELTTFAAQPYWVQRGYDRTGAVKTGSRIDLPRPFAQVKAGPVTVAGVAYDQHHGISAVQVRVDGGPWQEAELTTQVSLDTWRQWRLTWLATAGSHQIEVRAADRRGNLQPQARTPVFPSGATGWELVVVTVTT